MSCIETPLINLIAQKISYGGFKVKWNWKTPEFETRFQLAEFVGDSSGVWYRVEISLLADFADGDLGIAYEGVDQFATVNGLVKAQAGSRFEPLVHGAEYYVRLRLANFDGIVDGAASDATKIKLELPKSADPPQRVVFKLLVPDVSGQAPAQPATNVNNIFLTGSWVTDSLDGFHDVASFDILMSWSINGRPCYGCCLPPTSHKQQHEEPKVTPVRVTTRWKTYFCQSMLELLGHLKLREYEGLAKWLPAANVPSSPYNLWTENNLTLTLNICVASINKYGISIPSEQASVDIPLSYFKSIGSTSNGLVSVSSGWYALYDSGQLQSQWIAKCCALKPHQQPSPAAVAMRSPVAPSTPSAAVDSDSKAQDDAEIKRARARDRERLEALERARQHEREKLRKQQDLKRKEEAAAALGISADLLPVSKSPRISEHAFLSAKSGISTIKSAAAKDSTSRESSIFDIPRSPERISFVKEKKRSAESSKIQAAPPRRAANQDDVESNSKSLKADSSIPPIETVSPQHPARASNSPEHSKSLANFKSKAVHTLSSPRKPTAESLHHEMATGKARMQSLKENSASADKASKPNLQLTKQQIEAEFDYSPFETLSDLTPIID